MIFSILMAKKNKITKIYEALLNRVEKVCYKQEIVLLIKEYNRKFSAEIDIKEAIKYLSRHNYIKRIFNSFYYINSIDERKREYCRYEDRELLFSVLNKLSIKWYLGLSSALYESRNSWQVPVKMNIINNKFSGKRNILGVSVRFYKIKENLIFAVKKAKTKNNIRYFYSIPPKTYIDMVYLRTSKKLVNNKETKKYLKYFPKWVEKK